MVSSVLAERLWRGCLLFCGLLLFLQFWGPPSWLGVFPEAAFFRFLDALACDAVALLLCLGFRVLETTSRPRWRRVADLLAAASLGGFCLLIGFSRPLQEIELYLRIQASLVALVLSVLAVLRRLRRTTEDEPPMAGLLILAAPAFLAGWVLEVLVSETHAFLLLSGGAGLLLGAWFSFRRPGARPLPRSEAAKALSDREWEIVAHLREGKTNRDIADALFISIATVKSHLANIQEKTGARNRVEILRILLSADDESSFGRMEATARRAHALPWRNS